VFLAGPLTILFAALAVSSSSAATFEELSARAAAAREANRLPEAVQLYREALAMNPKWQAGWWFLGTILYDTNEYPGCRDALGHLVELKTDAAPAWGILGLCEFQTGEYPHSLTHIQRSLSLGSVEQPEMEKVLRYHEAILLARAGDFDRAIQKYVWFVRGGTPSPAFLSALGLAALRTPLLPQDVPAAQQDLFATAGMAALSQMAGDAAGAQRGFQTLLERYPNAHHVHYLYACSLLAANPEQAIQEFRRELEITPASGGALTMLAWALLNRGDSAAALPYAKDAARNEPAYAVAQYVLGRSLVETGDLAGGIQHLESAGKLDPENLENHLALAAAYPKAHRYQDARRERQRSLELTRAH
jgi:tetratricopeptide (TPR) repeat protein